MFYLTIEEMKSDKILMTRICTGLILDLEISLVKINLMSNNNRIIWILTIITINKIAHKVRDKFSILVP